MIIKIPIDIYKTSVYCYVGETDESVKSHYSRIVGKGDPDINNMVLDDNADARCLLHRSRLCFILFKEHPTVESVVHEMSHVVFFTLRECGLQPCWESEEAYTYLLGYLTKEFYRKSKINL